MKDHNTVSKTSINTKSNLIELHTSTTVVSSYNEYSHDVEVKQELLNQAALILVIDTNVLIAELLRQRGRELLINKRLTLYADEKVLEETNYELQKRVRQIVGTGKLSNKSGEDLLKSAFQVLKICINIFPETDYAYLEVEAKERIPRDPDDWHTVALAMHLNAGIWTQDNDFLGCGCSCWTTETLISRLQRLT